LPMKCFSVLPFAATLLVGFPTFSIRTLDPSYSEKHDSRQVMLILRGIANAENPRGKLDDEAALAYACRLRFRREVLYIAGNTYFASPQVEKPWRYQESGAHATTSPIVMNQVAFRSHNLRARLGSG
jgi:hypothetical protein